MKFNFESIKIFLKTFIEEFDKRYVVRGLIDGSLSTLGVVIGASTGSASIIIAAGIGGGIANGISNILGALTAERAMIEEERSYKEKNLLMEEGYLKKTSEYKVKVEKSAYCGIYDGISTIIGSVIPVIPFFIVKPAEAILLAIGLTLIILFVLGIYIGRLSRENLIIAGLKMVAGGVIVAIISKLVEGFF
ncbi:TIGR00267 family protein [Methanococcus voltae]|uniref:Membrane protein (TIGR00267 family) n=2 Tax=Methanococcus voltae TaxID=2188 RepID=A0ABT2EUR9_METVO|nr:TIGR00267 family protein [Methanococcus voltae]MBP2172072.1 putative membrane protein (TIGR00267 family) [Methanococcus voltae]MBP2200971.1 putative membrane protein (TIGR00267 family) [Methanococcus voltae]MCS3921695.1 putative membrane protein (TIGR00267 family) [Methanococcus voltae PS]